MYVCVKAWFTAPDAVSAPRNDLNLLKNLKRYEEKQAAISKSAVKNFQATSGI